MCTVALAHRLYLGSPIVLIANRDEALARPSSPPAARGDVFAPTDEVAGGTWLGVNRHGVVAAITNRFGHPRQPDRRSRGWIVLDALACPTAKAALDRVAELDPLTVNPFHLLVADAIDLGLVYHDGLSTIHRRALPPGWTVVTEQSLTAAETPAREAHIREQLARHIDAPPSPEQARRMLSEHARSSSADDRMAASCVHLDELGYGTRSSTYLYLGDAPSLFHADGPPCVTTPDDLSEALARFLG